MQASESLGPAEKDSTPFTPPAADCDDTGEMLWTVEAIEIWYPRFLLDLDSLCRHLCLI